MVSDRVGSNPILVVFSHPHMRLGRCARDLYWQKMGRVMASWYVASIGVILPLVLLGSIAYIVPGIMYCKNYSYQDGTPFTGIQGVRIGFGITSTVRLSAGLEPEFKQFMASCTQDAGGQLKCVRHRSAYACSNIYLVGSIGDD